MDIKTENDGVSSSVPAAGGVNVYSSAELDASTADHLVVMVNGILGRSNTFITYIIIIIIISSVLSF